MAGFGSPQDLLIVLAIVLLLFGSTKIPQLAKGLGEGIREFKKGVKEGGDDEHTAPPSQIADGKESRPEVSQRSCLNHRNVTRCRRGPAVTWQAWEAFY
jgi:sec-independent protein translocase protein TatA